MAFWVGVTMLVVFAAVLFLALYVVLGESVWLTVGVFAIAILGTAWIYYSLLLINE